MRSDDNIEFRARDEGELGDFGETSPSNSFSGGERDHLFLNYHGEQFYDLDGVSGLDHPGDGRTFCVFDYDRDGWVDFCVVSANAPTVQLYRNRIGDTVHADAEASRMIALRFVGGNHGAKASADWSPRDGYGAMVKVHVGDKPLLREHRCGDGRAAVNSSTMFIGISDVATVPRIDVRWPAGGVMKAEDLPAGHQVTFYENPAHSPTGEAVVVEPYLKHALRGRDLAGAAGPTKTLALDLPGADNGAGPELRVVTAMSTHCVTCKARQPDVRVLKDTFDASQVVVYGVGTDLEEDAATLDGYVRDHEPEYQVVSGLSLDQRAAVRQHVLDTFGEDLTPVSVVLDADGRVLKTVGGIPSVTDITKLLNR